VNRRSLAGVVLSVLLVGGVGALPAAADDPPTGPPAFTPPPLPNPSTVPSPGPTYVITPGAGGSTLGAPSDPKAVEKAKQADQQRSRHPAVRKVAPKVAPKTRKPPRTSTQVAGPQTPIAVPAAASEQVGVVLRGFAALVGIVVLFEITAVRRYVFRRRRVTVTAG
jgi:hypothetical protein